jgi:WD40 repeat protein
VFARDADVSRATLVTKTTWDSKYVQSISVSPDGMKVVSGSFSGVITLWGERTSSRKCAAVRCLAAAEVWAFAHHVRRCVYVGFACREPDWN